MHVSRLRYLSLNVFPATLHRVRRLFSRTMSRTRPVKRCYQAAEGFCNFAAILPAGLASLPATALLFAARMRRRLRLAPASGGTSNSGITSQMSSSGGSHQQQHGCSLAAEAAAQHARSTAAYSSSTGSRWRNRRRRCPLSTMRHLQRTARSSKCRSSRSSSPSRWSTSSATHAT